MSNSSRLLMAGLSALALTGTAGVAAAQDAGASDGEDIVVTGTRVQGRTRLDTVAPVDVISQESLNRVGSTELNQALTVSLPSFTFPRPAITDGTDSVRPATLRGLSPDQTLVLVNSHRRHASALVNINGSIGRGSAAVDLNAIPTAAISSVEVLRDGASAQYGSDAIAGVINLRLREASSGGGATITVGQYFTDFTTTRQPGGRSEEDGLTWTVSGWQGLALGDEGFLTVSAEYLDREPTSRGDIDPRLNGNPAISPTGSLVTSRYGDPTIEQGTLYLNGAVPVFGEWELYGWAGYQNREADSAANPRLAQTNTATGQLNSQQTIGFSFLPLIAPTVTDTTAALGIRGPVSGWDVDFGVVYGENDVEYHVENSLNAAIARANITPGIPNNPYFGATPQRSFYAGTLNYNQWVTNLGATRTFGEDTDTPVTLAFGLEYRAEEYSEEAGEPASWQFALNSVTGLPLVFPGLVNAPGVDNGQPGAGSQGFPGLQSTDAGIDDRDAWSAYAEAEANLTPQLLTSIAARYENYSDFGATLNGKVSARYDFTDAFALRGTVSSGFRAPSLQQSSFTATSTNFVNGIPVDVLTTPPDSPVGRVLGGQALQPEESINYTLGAIFRAGNFELTVDAYRVEITDRIVLSENIQGTNGGTATQQAIFNLIRSVNNTATAARFFINGVDTETEGVDIVARYRLPTDNLGEWAFTLSGNLNSTDVTRTPTTNVLSSLPVPPVLFPVNRVLEFEEGTPEHKYSLNVDWEAGNFGSTLRLTHYGTILVPQTTLANTYDLPEALIMDLEGRARIGERINLALGANNVLDEYPAVTPTINNANGPLAFSSFSPFGFAGRYVYGRVSVNW